MGHSVSPSSPGLVLKTDNASKAASSSWNGTTGTSQHLISAADQRTQLHRPTTPPVRIPLYPNRLLLIHLRNQLRHILHLLG